MADEIALNDVIEAKAICATDVSGPVQLAINAWHFKVTALAHGDSDVTLQAIAATLDQQFNSLYFGGCDSAFYWIGCGVRNLTSGSIEFGSSAFYGLLGGGTGTLPWELCGIFRISDGGVHRSNHGRKYLPFVPWFTATSTSVFDAAGLPTADYKTQWDSLVTFVTNDHPFTVGTSTYTLQPSLRHRDGTVTQIVSANVHSGWGWQRSRGSYGRVNNLPWWFTP